MIAIKTVLVATDFSPESETALRYGRTLARTFNGTLHVLHVVENFAARMVYDDVGVAGWAPAEVQAEIEQAARQKLQSVVGDDDRRELHAVEVLRAANNIAEAIVEYAGEAAVDLIVIGATGRGALNRMVMGSVADKVLRRAPCPVLAVRHPEHEFLVPDALQVVAHAQR